MSRQAYNPAYKAEQVVLQMDHPPEWIVTGPAVFGAMMKCKSEEMARHIANVMSIAYARGVKDARREMREALGISSWGGDMKCTD